MSARHPSVCSARIRINTTIALRRSNADAFDSEGADSRLRLRFRPAESSGHVFCASARCRVSRMTSRLVCCSIDCIDESKFSVHVRAFDDSADGQADTLRSARRFCNVHCEWRRWNSSDSVHRVTAQRMRFHDARPTVVPVAAHDCPCSAVVVADQPAATSQLRPPVHMQSNCNWHSSVSWSASPCVSGCRCAVAVPAVVHWARGRILPADTTTPPICAAVARTATVTVKRKGTAADSKHRAEQRSTSAAAGLDVYMCGQSECVGPRSIQGQKTAPLRPQDDAHCTVIDGYPPPLHTACCTHRALHLHRWQ